MALVAFLRGVNVGGNRRFRPSLVARELAPYGVVNIGAAGTFVARTPGAADRFRAALAGKLPFATEIALCTGEEILRLVHADPFRGLATAPDIVPFVSVRVNRAANLPALPRQLPAQGEWLLRLTGGTGPFVLGTYRREMKAIGLLGQLDRICGGAVTTRNWRTMLAVARVLER